MVKVDKDGTVRARSRVAGGGGRVALHLHPAFRAPVDVGPGRGSRGPRPDAQAQGRGQGGGQPSSHVPVSRSIQGQQTTKVKRKRHRETARTAGSHRNGIRVSAPGPGPCFHPRITPASKRCPDCKLPLTFVEDKGPSASGSSPATKGRMSHGFTDLRGVFGQDSRGSRLCRHRHLVIPSEDDGCFWVQCVDCLKTGPHKNSISMAILAWVVSLANGHPRRSKVPK